MHASAFIALGTNMPFGGAEGCELLRRALVAMREAGFVLRARSSVWRTEAWPAGSGQADYHNAVVEIDASGFTPQSLYAALREIEGRFGRTRREKWEPRTLDLDIVAIGDLAGSFDGIDLPHARMHERAFVLAPLAEIAAEWRHPSLRQTAAELLAGLMTVSSYRLVGSLVDRSE